MRCFFSLVISWVFISSNCFSEDVGEKICSLTHCYTVIRELGEGAFGKVHLVEDERGAKFALKCFKDYRSAGADDPLCLARKEFECGQLLNHPNIIKTYDLFSHNSKDQEMQPCLLLEFVDGKDLTEKSSEKISPNKSLEMALQLVCALRHALLFNLFFVDSNEGNIMVDEEGNLKLIDLSSFSHEPQAYYPDYFDVITEKCLLLIRRSDLNRAEKFNLFLKIKQVAWNYHEDLEEGKSFSLDGYFEELTQILENKD